jgi:hypothetical protein
MRVGVYVLLSISACCAAVSGQTSDPSPASQAGAGPDQTDPSLLPPGPEQIRDREIRQYDPLDKGDKDDKDRRDKTKAARGTENGGQEADTPIPGSVADSNQQNARQRSGPEVVGDDETAPVQDYGGPGVLSRSYSIDRPMIPEEVKWHETFGISAVYDTGAYGAYYLNGNSNNTALVGTMMHWSFSGRHYFRRDQIGISYTGSLSRYSGPCCFNGSNNSVTLDYMHAISRHLSLNLAGTGQLLSQNYVLENPFFETGTIANVNLSTSPNIQIFNAGMKQFSTVADLVWQKTSRLSFDGGVTYFALEQNSAFLMGVTGAQARGDVNYRLTRQTTVGAYYSYSYYLYPHGFGYARINTGGLIYSYAINRTTQLRFRGGASRVYNFGQQTVAIAPAIAALLGVGSGVIDASESINASDISAQFVKDFSPRTTATIAYSRGITPGNGFYLASQTEIISAGFTARVMRTYSLQAGIGRMTMTSLGQYLGTYQNEFAEISLNRAYKRGVGLSLGLTYRYFNVTQFVTVRNEVRVTTGFTWGSGNGRLWPF